MISLIKIIREAEKKRVAVGHFNVSNLEMLKAVSHVAEKMKLPVVIGVSEGERGYIGIHHIRDLVLSYNKEHSGNGYRLFLNADHTYSLEKAKEAAREGFDSIIFDGSKLPFKENIKRTREAVRAVKKINKNAVVEGELGFIGQSSKILKKLPEGAVIKPRDLPTAAEALRFVKETGVDMLAPAVGNIHGMMEDAKNPNLQIERIREIKKAVRIPLVLHGGSGISGRDFRAAIKAGISLIHISTELRVAWRGGLERALKESKDEIAPYKIMPKVLGEMEEVIKGKLRLFGGL
ncbi:MAG: class II fructose-bisphosphate aldolase [Candidatus Jorgensenbacteria bacterium]